MAYFPGLSTVLFQGQSNGSPILLALIVVSVAGAVADYKYKKAGGRKPSKRDRILFLIVVLVVVGFIIWADTINPAMAALSAIPIVPWLLFAWELGRWRMRRKYPLRQPEQPSNASATE